MGLACYEKTRYGATLIHRDLKEMESGPNSPSNNGVGIRVFVSSCPHIATAEIFRAVSC